MAAIHGIEVEYTRLVEPHRRELHAHCYRMLGSSEEAEEALQEALLRAWRALDGFEGRSSVRSWLYRISTNACLDAIGRRKPVVPIDYEPTDDPHHAVAPEAVTPSPEAELEERETVEQAFLVALEHLHPRPRAVLIMREALGFSARETAAALDTSVAAVNSALQRARAALDGEAAAIGPSAKTDAHTLGRRYADALRQGEVETIVEALAAGLRS